MAPGCFSGIWCRRQPPSPSDDRIVSPVPAPTGITRPGVPLMTFTFVPTEMTVQDSGSPSDNRGIRDATAVAANRPGTSHGPGHVEIPVPAPTQGSLPTGTDALTPALTDVQPTGPHYPEDSADVPVLAQAEEVPSGSPSSRPAYRLDPLKAKEHIDRIRRFRILVMGRANAGKTTILQRVCNTTDKPEIFNGKGGKVDASVVEGSLTRGHHIIEDELVFQSNPGFVFHDSCGFEAGSEEQFDMMKNFVRDRAKRIRLDERIHAIWFCIPLNESHRMVMAAEKKFFDECDTGYVPVILLATKADTLELEAFEKLEEQGLNVDDETGSARLQEEILVNNIEKIKNWLGNTRFPPHVYLPLAGMEQEGANCVPLVTCTANALKEEGLQQLLISTQQSNLELCMEFAIMKSVKRYVKKWVYKIQPAPLAYYMSLWFPLGGLAGLLGEAAANLKWIMWFVVFSPHIVFYGLHGLPISLITSPSLHNSSPCLHCLPQCYIQGSILLNKALVKNGRNNMQDSLTLAVKEYQSSGIHAKVNESIQKAFEKYGNNVDHLCHTLVHIAKKNQLSKILTRKG